MVIGFKLSRKSDAVRRRRQPLEPRLGGVVHREERGRRVPRAVEERAVGEVFQSDEAVVARRRVERGGDGALRGGWGRGDRGERRQVQHGQDRRFQGAVVCTVCARFVARCARQGQ
jgi:hypothetical protein